MAGGEAAFKDARFSQFAAQIGSPTPRFAARKASLVASLTAVSPPASRAVSSIRKAQAREVFMTMISAVPVGEVDVYARLIAGLQLEFGFDDGGAVAERIIASEEADFLWEARVAERYLGQYVREDCAVEELRDELAEMSIISFLGGRWHVGVCLVDGDGAPTDMLWNRTFSDGGEAETAFETAR